MLLSLLVRTRTSDASSDFTEKQNTLIRWFSMDWYPSMRDRIIGPKQEQEICLWKGFECTDDTLTAIEFRDLNMGNCFLSFIPPTVRRVEISGCQQSYGLRTRRFPREARRIDLRINAIFGTVDLTTLPQHIASFLLTSNEMTGPINLTQLPEALTELFLDGNPIGIQGAFQYFTNLPPKISEIRLDEVLFNELQGATIEDEERGKDVFSYTGR